MLNLFFIMSSFRRRTRGKSAKYSNSTANIADHYTVQEPTVITIGTTRSVPVVPATDTFGTRKVKNFTLTIDSNNYEMPMAWALVYVPDGQEPSKLTVTGIADNKIPELYKPNQNVIMQGILNPASNYRPLRFTTRLARNLDSGDSIYLVFAPYGEQTAQVGVVYSIIGTCNYSIKF